MLWVEWKISTTAGWTWSRVHAVRNRERFACGIRVPESAEFYTVQSAHPDLYCGRPVPSSSPDVAERPEDVLGAEATEFQTLR